MLNDGDYAAPSSPVPGAGGIDGGNSGNGKAHELSRAESQEVAGIRQLISLATLSVLFGPARRGKTWVLHNGVFPRLRQERYLPVPVHIDVESTAPRPGEQVLIALHAAASSAGGDDPPYVADERLWEHFHRADRLYWSADHHVLTPVIVLDQFEELLADRVSPESSRRVREFMVELAEVVENRVPLRVLRRLEQSDMDVIQAGYSVECAPLRVVLCLQEDFLPRLEEFKELLPSLQRNQMRLARVFGRDLGANGGRGNSIRARAMDLLEDGQFGLAIEQLERLVAEHAGDAQKSTAEDLLGLAHYMLEQYEKAARYFDIAARDAEALVDRVKWEAWSRLARANHDAAIAAAPPVSEFDAAELLAPPAIGDADLPQPPEPGKRSLSARVYALLGDSSGRVMDVVFEKMRTGMVARHDASQSIWTTWDREPLWLGLLTLAHMREQLETQNLKNPYPDGVRTAFQQDLVAPGATAWFRTYDGSWNDPKNPREGSANVRFPRNVDARAAFPDRGTLDEPSVARISEELLARRGGEMQAVPFLNLLAASWIQFMVHDWVSHRTFPPNGSAHVLAVPDGLPIRTEYYQKEIRIGKTMPDPTRQPLDAGSPPTTINEVTSWWDASQLYGSDVTTAARLRAGVDGKLRLDGEFLPRDSNGDELAGYQRNWWVGLSILHTLFVKEHNAICDRLRELNPIWDDERLFHTARLINAAIMAKIHTVEWTPAILPNPTLKLALEANWYGLLESRLFRKRRKVLRRIKIRHGVVGGLVGNPVEKHGVPYGLSEEFVEVYRLHELLPDSLSILNLGRPAQQEQVMLVETRGRCAPTLAREHGIANLIASFAVQSPGQITLHNYPDSLRRLAVPGAPVLDVAAADVLRARERGVPRYNAFRRQLGLRPIRHFEDLTDDAEDVATLRRIYGNVEQLDMHVGTRAERTRPRGFGFGETLFQIFILNASRRLQADHFFTDAFNAETYTQAGLDWIDDATFKSVLLRHYPELAATGLTNVENAFEPWDSAEGLTEARHPLRYIDQPSRLHRAVEGLVEGGRAAVSKVKSLARQAAEGAGRLQTVVRAAASGASVFDPLPPGSFGLPVLGESAEFIKGSGPFLEKRYRTYGPIFKTHVAGQPTVCLGGA